MNENQMNRVIQALECCKSEEGLCAGCPYFKYINSNTGITCQEQLANDALDLIRQLKGELNQFVNADKLADILEKYKFSPLTFIPLKEAFAETKKTLENVAKLEAISGKNLDDIISLFLMGVL